MHAVAWMHFVCEFGVPLVRPPHVPNNMCPTGGIHRGEERERGIVCRVVVARLTDRLGLAPLAPFQLAEQEVGSTVADRVAADRVPSGKRSPPDHIDPVA